MENRQDVPFRVFVRVRPLNEKEKAVRTDKAVRFEDNLICVTGLRGSVVKENNYAFDKVFAERCDNLMIYKDQVAALVSDVCYGLNGTCFAYGMTGAGKTHTMLGVLGDKNEKGLIYLAVDDTVYSMAQKRTDFVLKLSYLEIYNEHVRDLLAQGGNLMVVEDPNKGVIIPNLQEFQITSSSDAKVLIDTGNLARVMASTAANQFSTRSHAVLQLVLEQVTKSSNPSSQFTTVLTSKLCLIDLAGSERAASTENRGQRMVEGANINRSLLALGNCINILSDSSKRGKFIPYRDSKLTRILKESLCGNTQTIMIACISPAHSAVEETLNTLKYAERARNIKNKVTQNTKEVETHNLEYKEIINNLKNEIEMLKNQLKNSEEVSIEKEPLQSEDLEDISNKIMNNFEEHWEIKKSIREIEILNEENTAKMKKLIGKYQSEDLSSKELRAIKHELIFLKQSIKENEEARSELLENLYVNLKAKSNLQQTMSILKKDDKREILELQIMLRNLKLEALDLHFQNSQIKQEAQKNKEESQAKDLIINKMKQEIEDMRKQISTMTAPSFNNTQVDEFTASFNFSKVSLEESPTVKQFLLSPKASEKKITLSKLEEARRARKEVRNSGKEEKTCENFPDKLRAYSVSNNFKPLEEKPVQKSSKGAFSNIYQIESMKDRYKSVERHRTPTQREEEMKKAAAKHVVQQKSQSNISHLLKGMNVKLLTTNEANELVKNSWNSKKKTPAVAISLRK